MSVTIGETEKFVDKMMRVKLETGGITLKMMGRLQKTDREKYSINPDWGNDNKIFFSQSDIKEIQESSYLYDLIVLKVEKESTQ